MASAKGIIKPEDNVELKTRSSLDLPLPFLSFLSVLSWNCDAEGQDTRPGDGLSTRSKLCRVGPEAWMEADEDHSLSASLGNAT